mmetsp:Transcript_57872/g.179845  ORF Transcript_57872/g.179845 Transcript_57872/m.179845 type:complete len:343 (-) Transcript_57872:100-1128(-)
MTGGFGATALLLAALLAPSRALRRDGLRQTPPAPEQPEVQAPRAMGLSDADEAAQMEEGFDAAFDLLCRKRLADHYKTFNEKFATKFARHFANHARPSYVIMAEAREVRLLNNSLAHLASVQEKTKADTMVTVVSLDQDADQACRSYTRKMHRRIDCVDLSGWIDDDFMGFQRDNRYLSGVYRFMVALKPLIVYNAVRSSPYGVVFLDADVIVRGDLLGYAQTLAAEAKCSIATSDDTNRHKSTANKTNTGIVYAAPSALGIVRQWSERMVPACGCSGDMPVFNSLRSHDPRIFKDIKLIPDEMVAGRGREAVYAAHYNNCGETLADKIVIMKQNGEWWLDH